MEKEIIESFSNKWKKYFGKVELPITYYYTSDVTEEELKDSRHDDWCIISNLNRVREGHTFVYNSKSTGCTGGKRYTGYSQIFREDIEYFLSSGIPGKMEGERYKKSRELVKEFLKNHPLFKAPAKYLVFKHWDNLLEKDEPLAVVFFANPDVLSGLFTLANFDSADPNAVIAPMGSGCNSIISYPLKESKSANPRCVLGMFDISARPCVQESNLTFTIPAKRFEVIVQNMDESFLITESWNQVRQRINKKK